MTMHKAKALCLVAALVGAALGARDASACGGCFAGPSESTQITGEKMLLTISQQQTTLYDEITYSGSPDSFAWVLPIHGTATVGLSSDALFQNLGADTAVTISAPVQTCPSSNCGNYPGDSFGAGGGGGASGGGGVTVLSQAVVGPYETVQLQSTDPMALRNWLAAHNYQVPAADGPVIDAYTSEGFNFLALKLVPGKDVSAMRPVRVTTTGATPTLPLRMVAVGSGPIVPITLWVIAEGRYDTANMPSFQIDPTKLVWDWDTQSSNYSQLKDKLFKDSNNTGWLIEAAEPFSMFTIQDQLSELVQTDPVGSGYGDDDIGTNAQQNLENDMTVLFMGIPDGSVWITRFEGALSQAALKSDLQIMASSDQTQLNRYFQATDSTGTPPPCPPVQTCGGDGSSGGSWPWPSGNPIAGGSGHGCNVSTSTSDSAVLSGLALLAALAVSRRRRRR